MGSLWRFSCTGCGNEATVSGGNDAGMMALTTTVSCSGCRELHNAVVGSPELGRTQAPECPNDPSHRVAPWEHPGPCPRCGRAMARLFEEVLWD